jgi:hypothetical protein
MIPPQPNRLADELKPVNRVEIRRDPQEFLADEGRPIDIRIYVSPKAIAAGIAALAVVGRLVEAIAEAVINRLR